MQRSEPAYVDRIRRKYNGIDEIWEASDRWHLWTKRQIEQVLVATGRQFLRGTSGDGVILDVGSAGHAYFPAPYFRIDIDIAENSLRSCKHPVCANAEPPPDYVVYPASYTSFVSGRVSKRRQKNRKWGKDSSRARCSLACLSGQ